MSINCKLCQFSTMTVGVDQTQPAGLVCRRHPPQAGVIGFPTQQGIAAQVLTLWVQVKADDWCAEGKPMGIALENQ